MSSSLTGGCLLANFCRMAGEIFNAIRCLPCAAECFCIYKIMVILDHFQLCVAQKMPILLKLTRPERDRIVQHGVFFCTICIYKNACG
jgi:hypothetical protein